jgi:hypothetical protein
MGFDCGKSIEKKKIAKPIFLYSWLALYLAKAQYRLRLGKAINRLAYFIALLSACTIFVK